MNPYVTGNQLVLKEVLDKVTDVLGESFLGKYYYMSKLISLIAISVILKNLKSKTIQIDDLEAVSEFNFKSD